MIIYEFQKNNFEKVKVELNNFRGKDLINIRVYYLADSKMDDWKPSPKGIAMHLDLLPELKKGIDRAYKEWEKKR
jgi:hypothetical protein